MMSLEEQPTTTSTTTATNGTKSSSSSSSSSLLEEEKEVTSEERMDDANQRLLHQVIQDVGRYADGIAAVEVWIYHDETGTLIRPLSLGGSSSWWTNTDIMTHRTDALRRLDDPTYPNYEHPLPCHPGCDLAGILWSNTSGGTNRASTIQKNSAIATSTMDSKRAHQLDHYNQFLEQSTATATTASSIQDHNHHYQPQQQQQQRRRKFKGSSMAVTFSLQDTIQEEELTTSHYEDEEEGSTHPEITRDSTTTIPTTTRKQGNTPSILGSIYSSVTQKRHPYFIPTLVFRDIHSILQNPDDSKTSRLLLLKEAGFTHAAGIRFSSGTRYGLVIYYTTTALLGESPTTKNYYDLTTLSGKRAQAKEYYLIHATEYIGSTLAYIDARNALLELVVPTTPTVTAAAAAAAPHLEEEDRFLICSSSRIQAIQAWWYKCHGANLPIPPAFSWGEALFTLVASSISILVVMGINFCVYNANDTSFLGNLAKYIALGPLTSTVAAEYLLSSAPAAQPRNNILGFIVTGIISMLVICIPEHTFPKWVIVTLASVCSIFALGKMGLPCPPAASFAVVITAGEEYNDWIYVTVTIVIVILLCIIATLINNLDKNRQYPVYWGFLPNDCYAFLFSHRKKREN